MIYTVDSATSVLRRLTYNIGSLHTKFYTITSNNHRSDNVQDVMDENRWRNCQRYTHQDCIMHLGIPVSIMTDYIARDIKFRDENYLPVIELLNKYEYISLFKEIMITIRRIYTGIPETEAGEHITGIYDGAILLSLLNLTILRLQVLDIPLVIHEYEKCPELVDDETEFPSLPESNMSKKTPPYASVWQNRPPHVMKPSIQLGTKTPGVTLPSLENPEHFPSLSSTKHVRRR